MYKMKTQKVINEHTGKEQVIPREVDKNYEIALGLQAMPQMVRQHGGEIPEENEYARLVDQVGHRLVNSSSAKNSGYPFEFRLLNDTETVNAFALPGGQIFITMALLSKLPNEDALAGVIGHEIGHVLGRHSLERMAKTDLFSGLAQAGGILVGGDMGMGGQQSAQVFHQLMSTKYGRDDERESDYLGVKYMLQAGYDPMQMVAVMRILKNASGGAGPEILSSHPDPGNRAEDIPRYIKQAKAELGM